MESLFGLTVRSTLHSTTTNAETTAALGGSVRACAYGQVWACAVQAAAGACHCSKARFVLRRSQLSPPGGEGSGMRQQNVAAECDSRWGRQSHDFGYFGRNNERALRHGMHEFRARAGRCGGRAWATGRLGSLNGSQEDDRSLLLTGGGAASRGRWLVRVRAARVMADQGDWGSG
jgi:hypothetical protein